MLGVALKHNKERKQIVAGIQISMKITEDVEKSPENIHYNQQFLSQEIVISNYSNKNIIMQCNSNNDKEDFIGISFLDNMSNENETENLYSIIYSDNKPYSFINKYYFSSSKEKTKLLNLLNRDYFFKIYEYKYQEFSYGDSDVVDPNKLYRKVTEISFSKQNIEWIGTQER